MEEGTGQPQPLPFAAGQGVPQFSHRGIVPLGQGEDEVVDGGLLAGLFHLLPGGVGAGNENIFQNGVVEQVGVLGHIPLHGAQIGGIDVPHVSLRDGHRSALAVPEPHEQL